MSDENNDETKPFGRRAGDVEGHEAKKRMRANNLTVLQLGLAAMALLAIIASVSATLLFIQSSRGSQALDKSHTAVQAADVAVQRSDVALSKLQSAQARQRTQLQEGCVRLNILRSTVNANGSYLFVLLRTAARGANAPQPNETPQQRRQSKSFGRLLDGVTSRLAWTPLTNCVIAVAIHGSSYMAPSPIRFSVKRPPPSALDPKNASKPMPVGSIP